MKKVLATVLALAMLLSLGAISAMAAGSLPEDAEIAYTDVKGSSPVSTDSAGEIPVYGYVGPDAEIDDDDDDDPETPPTASQINVSVPVKILWAAFESATGTIEAPNYHITNNSMTNKLKVTVLSFQAKYGNADNTAVDKDLDLNIVGDKFGTILVVDGNGSGATYYTNSAALSETFTAGAVWDFTLTGTWGGTFVLTPYNPSYDLVLKFELTA